ncbi:hypothetical protein SCLCIDRAFT_586419 [Scleroderma citrinum Foug A]|uniref:Uncharacterized protein n=1 Tax=Scleroderma citrinum Foug A TaxID=1036808 RepID=A0A0C3DWV6_9AGAM|nr:hypothetical protein SCLCIDRAFT_586419 [Scleroderma citrinum Foug A]
MYSGRPVTHRHPRLAEFIDFYVVHIPVKEARTAEDLDAKLKERRLTSPKNRCTSIISDHHLRTRRRSITDRGEVP